MADLLRILRVMRGQYPWFLAGILLGLAVVAANALLMALSGWFIASMALAGVGKTAFNYFIPAAAIRVLAISRTIGRYAERLVTHSAAFRALADLRLWLFNGLTGLLPASLPLYSSGEIAGRLRADVDSLENLYMRIIAPLVTGAAGILLAVAFVSCWDGLTAGVLLLSLGVSGLLLPLAAARLARAPALTATATTGELRGRVTDGLRGGVELLLLGAVDRYVAETESVSERAIAAQDQLAVRGALISAIGQLLAGAGSLGVLAAAAVALQLGRIDGAQLVMLLLFAAASFEAVGGMPAALLHYRTAAAAARRLLELAGTGGQPLSDRPVLPPPAGGDVVFRGVTFAYPGQAPVLTGFDLVLPAGGRVALTGPSGCGKSTVAALLGGYPGYSGSITVAGREVSRLPDDELCAMLAVQRQDSHIFDGTIRENLLLGRPEATAAEIVAALHDAALDEWVSGLPAGLDTRVGEGGTAISGGEARRLAVARALLKAAPVLVLDEPTEGLDDTTERLLLTRLHRRLPGQSLLLVSHRPAPLEIVDRVVRLTPPA